MLATKIEREDGGWRMEDGIRRARRKLRRPSSILHLRVLLFLALAALLAGCAPPGPRALLAGKKLLDRGDYDGAVAQLKTATTLLATNAAAWNYYGVALQHAGQPADAAQAYQNALKFDRDLMEAHYNLGCLWLEQEKNADAKAEFTAYTLRRNNTPEGWLKLGGVQLKLRELRAAETSFSTAQSLNPNNAEALNGLGLACMAENRPEDAAKFFSAAVHSHPECAPALLNLATVQEQDLHDHTSALENYRAYLGLTPRPANWDAVNDLVRRLAQAPLVAAAKPPPAAVIETVVPAKPSPAETRPPVAATRPPVAPRTQQVARPISAPPRLAAATETVTVQPETPIIGASASAKDNLPPETPAETTTARKPGVLHRINPVHWFGASTQAQNYSQAGVTPLTANNQAAASAAPPPPAPAPIKLVQPAPPTFPRYLYLSPRKPRAGDRKKAEAVFVEAQKFEHNDDLAQAMNSYRRAAELDPAWFEAQYNCAVLAYRVHNLDQALVSSEMALAIQPDSVDARYNFALALKSDGYVTDAVNELEKIASGHPNEARAQLALGNLYAEQMNDPARARPHYLKWLALDPHNPSASNIRYWLSANPP